MNKNENTICPNLQDAAKTEFFKEKLIGINVQLKTEDLKSIT